MRRSRGVFISSQEKEQAQPLNAKNSPVDLCTYKKLDAEVGDIAASGNFTRTCSHRDHGSARHKSRQSRRTGQ